jgi:hypothetical protein
MRSVPHGACAIYCGLVPPNVLLEGAAAPSSAAIVGRFPLLGAKVNANIGSFLPTVYSAFP